MSDVDLSVAQTDRIIQMAWEDRTTFDAIKVQFGLEPGEVIKLMRKNLKPSSFRNWRSRTTGRTTKHASKRSFKVGRFRCKSQRG
ncbi:MAG: TIGR03643 family protein [Mariniblastus sp.]